MDIKKGIAVIVFDENKGKKFFLLLHRVLGWKGWEFIKDKSKFNETYAQAILRAVKKETGLVGEIVCKTENELSWGKGDIIYYYTIFVVKVNMATKIKLQDDVKEHDAYKWVEAHNVDGILTHDNSRKIFRAALTTLKRQK